MFAKGSNREKGKRGQGDLSGGQSLALTKLAQILQVLLQYSKSAAAQKGKKKTSSGVDLQDAALEKCEKRHQEKTRKGKGEWTEPQPRGGEGRG